jgi:hypothetical protein
VAQGLGPEFKPQHHKKQKQKKEENPTSENYGEFFYFVLFCFVLFCFVLFCFVSRACPLIRYQFWHYLIDPMGASDNHFPRKKGTKVSDPDIILPNRMGD